MTWLLYGLGFVVTFVVSLLLLRLYDRSEWEMPVAFAFVFACVWPVALPIELLILVSIPIAPRAGVWIDRLLDKWFGA